MTDAPPPGQPGDDEHERPAQPVYPPPYGQRTSDDELAAAFAAQTAMYTGPITLPVVNEDGAFRPDPTEVHGDVPPPPGAAVDAPVPVVAPAPASPPAQAPESAPVPSLPPIPIPPPPAEPEYVADDLAAGDAEGLDFGTATDHDLDTDTDLAAPPRPEGESAAETWGDDPLSRSVQEEAQSGSTLDAILLLEAELRRRQGLPSAPPVAPPADAGAALAGAPLAAAAFAAPPPNPESGIPGWTPAPDPEREGESTDPDAAATPAEEPWLAAPPPTFAPPELVEPPVQTVEPLDPATLTPIPETAVPAAVDVTLLPPPSGAPVDAFGDAPGPAPAASEAATGEDGLEAAPVAVAAGVAASAAPVEVPAAAAEPPAQPASDPVANDADPDAFTIETASLAPTPLEQRAGHAARMYWLWFAANASVVMFAIGALVVTQGASLRQALVAIVAGIGLSALPLGLGTLAGKWSGQPTMVVSRASFGTTGNIVPAILAVLSRALWGGVMLWLFAATTTTVLVGPGGDVVGFIVLGVGALLVALVAGFGYGMLHRIQRILGILSTILVIATVALTADHVDIAAALRIDDGSWALAIGGCVLVFGVVGLAWAQSGSDLARYQRPGGSGAANMLWASFGVIVPTIAILSWGALLAASDPEIASGLAAHPIATILELVPAWFAIPLLGASIFGLMSAAIVATYSGGLAIVATGLRVPRAIGAIVATALAVGVAVMLLLAGGPLEVVADIVTTIAVPVAAWAGIFAGEMMIRLRRFHTPSLLVPGGVYPRVRTVNLVGLLVISGIGFGLTSASIPGLDWQGFLYGLLGVAADDPFAASDVGVLVALGLGLLLTVATAIPAIRRQERDDAPSLPTAGMPAVDAS